MKICQTLLTKSKYMGQNIYLHIYKERQKIIRWSLIVARWSMEKLLSFWTQKKTMHVVDQCIKFI